MLRASLSLGAAMLVCAHAPTRLSAQSDPRLVAAVRLAQEGQGDSARSMVKRIIDATPAANPLYPEALYAAGRVAATNVERERQFQRLVVEFNGSAWSDDALLQLMQMNFARGDLPGVVRTAERLAGDYPTSEVIPQAAVWAARAYFREDSTAAGCRWVTNGLARADTLDVELRNGLMFLGGRCSAAQAPPQQAPPQRDSGTAAPAPTPTPTPTTPVDTTRHPAPNTQHLWSVQIASSTSQANADALVRRLARDGFADAFVVRDGAAFKVRVGKLAARPDADALLARVRAKYAQAFVVETTP